MALDASKNNRASERKSSIIIYSDIYSRESLTEDEIIKFMNFENFLINDFLNLSQSGKSKKIKSFKNQYLSMDKELPIEDKQKLFKELSQFILSNDSKYEYHDISYYSKGIVIFYKDKGKEEIYKIDLEKKEHPELEKILELKPKDMENKLREFKKNNNLSKNLLKKVDITIDVLSQKNK